MSPKIHIFYPTIYYSDIAKYVFGLGPLSWCIIRKILGIFKGMCLFVC